MASRKQITDFLGRKRLAIIGVSRNPQDFRRSLFREFLRRGYDAVPVNPTAGEVDGHRCFAHVEDIKPPVEAALLLTSPAVTEQVVEGCAAAGVQRVWMHRGAGLGAYSPKAAAFCASKGLSVVAGECPLMFLPEAGFFHRLHGMVRRLTGRYPH